MTSDRERIFAAGMDWRKWQNQLIAWCRDGGWRVISFNDSRTMHWSTSKGWPDIVAFKAPRMLAIEAKTGSGRLTPDQQAWKDELVACGFEWLEARPEAADTARSQIFRGVSDRDRMANQLDRTRRVPRRLPSTEALLEPAERTELPRGVRPRIPASRRPRRPTR